MRGLVKKVKSGVVHGEFQTTKNQQKCKKHLFILEKYYKVSKFKCYGIKNGWKLNLNCFSSFKRLTLISKSSFSSNKNTWNKMIKNILLIITRKVNTKSLNKIKLTRWVAYSGIHLKHTPDADWRAGRGYGHKASRRVNFKVLKGRKLAPTTLQIY